MNRWFRISPDADAGRQQAALMYGRHVRLMWRKPVTDVLELKGKLRHEH